MSFHSYWYLGLAFLSLLLFIYICLKVRSYRVFMLLLTMIGFGYLIESVIYNFLHSYLYYPHLLHNPYYDSNLGAIASNAFALPVSAVFIAVFHKKWPWIAMFICFFAAIETLFIHLHIYKQNWWRTPYTSFGLIFYYILAKVMFKKIWQPLTGFWHFLIMFLNVSAILATLQSLPYMLFSSRLYVLGWFKNASLDTNAFGSFYCLGSSLFVVLIAKLPLKQMWLKAIVVALGTNAADLILIQMGILHSLSWWDEYYYIISPVAVFILANAAGKRLAAGPSLSCPAR